MTDGYWVVTDDRASGRAATSHLFSDHDQAYRHALDTQTPDVCTTVVARSQFGADRNLVNRC